jgi:hypothetical protein
MKNTIKTKPLIQERDAIKQAGEVQGVYTNEQVARLAEIGRELKVTCTPAVAAVKPICSDLIEGEARRAWIVDECPDAGGFQTIRIADGSKNGNINEEPIATVYSPNNARLIASAPDLLAALDDLHALSHGAIREHLTVENLAATMRARITTARVAIALARGESEAA